MNTALRQSRFWSGLFIGIIIGVVMGIGIGVVGLFVVAQILAAMISLP